MSAYTESIAARLADGVSGRVESTGGGNTAYIIRKRGSNGALYITDGNLEAPREATDAEAIYFPDEDDMDTFAEVATDAHTVASFANSAL